MSTTGQASYGGRGATSVAESIARARAQAAAEARRAKKKS